MGMSLDPSLYDYSDIDSQCYPEGLTPRVLYMSVVGIGVTEYWIPDVGKPMNGVWRLVQISETRWQYTSGLIIINFTVDSTGSYFELVNENGNRCMAGGTPNLCQRIFKPEDAGYNDWFTPGSIAVYSREPAEDEPDPSMIADAMGIPKDLSHFVDVSSSADGVLSYRFSVKDRNWTIHIKTA